MKEFAKEAKVHGLCMFPSETRKRLTASKWWCSRTTPLKSSAFSTTSALTRSKRRQAKPQLPECRNRKSKLHSPGAKTETVKTEQGEVEFEVGGFEDDFNIGPASRMPPKILLLAGRNQNRRKRSVRAFLAQQKLFAQLNKP